MPGTTFQPGDLVRRFAALYGWPVRERTVLVEGESDQRYLELADRLYKAETGLSLISPQIAIFPTGIGDDGGAFGLQRHFHPLRTIMDRDVTLDGKKIFHAITLFDCDLEGRRGFGALTGQHLNYKKWRDVFLLQRSLPRTTRDATQLAKLIESTNQVWRGLDCEIEDLVGSSVISAFVEENPGAVFRPHEERSGGVRCFLKREFKAPFRRFVETNALLRDIEQLVETLKFLRYHLGLVPDGEAL